LSRFYLTCWMWHRLRLAIVMILTVMSSDQAFTARRRTHEHA
jgi:hypothetical protein